MEKQKLHDVEKWLRQIPEDGNVVNDLPDSPYHTYPTEDAAEFPDPWQQERLQITKYKYYIISALVFAIILLLNGALMTPLGFAGYSYSEYYSFEIFGPLFLGLSGMCMLTAIVFYIKRRKLIQLIRMFEDAPETVKSAVSACKTMSTVTMEKKKERNRYRQSAMFVLGFGVLLLLNGGIMTPLGLAENNTIKYFPFDVFGPILLVAGLTCAIVASILFYKMLKLLNVEEAPSIEQGEEPCKKRGNHRTRNNSHKRRKREKSRVSTRISVTESEEVEIKTVSNEHLEPDLRNSATCSDSSSSQIWIKIDSKVKLTNTMET